MKHIISKTARLFLLLAIILPVFSYAQSISDLQSQINVLLEQVKSLQAQLLSHTGQTASAFCYTFNNNLKLGDRNEDVTNLYRAMVEQGFLNQNDAIQNSSVAPSFDKKLVSAVNSFQEKYKNEILAPVKLSHGTGYVGLRTRVKLNSLYGCSSPTTTVRAPTSNTDTVPQPPAPVVVSTTTATTTPITTPTTATVVSVEGLGDVNLDGFITTLDSQRIQFYIDGLKYLTGQALINADVDGDKKVGKADIRIISDYANCLISVFPVGHTTVPRTCIPTTQ